MRNFLQILNEKFSDINQYVYSSTDIEGDMVSPGGSPAKKDINSYSEFMKTCYESLGDFVQNLKREQSESYEIQVGYYFQTITFSTLMPLVSFFTSLEFSQDDFDSKFSQLLKRKDDLRGICKRIERLTSSDESLRKTSLGNCFLVFSKKRVEHNMSELLKKDLSHSLDFFRHRESANPLEVNSLEPVYELRERFTKDLSHMDLQMAELLREYIRNIDLNYIEATKAYYKEKLTLRTLLQRDKINKKFTKMKGIRMGLDNNSPVYSCEPASDYLLSKMNEIGEDLVLTYQDMSSSFISKNSLSFEKTTSSFVPSTPTKPFSYPNKDQIHRGLELIMGYSKPEHSIFSSEIKIDFEEDTSSKYKLYLGYISAETKIRKKYFQGLLICLARSRSQYENRFINAFEVTMHFSLSVLEKNIAYIFIEKHLEKSRDLGFRVEEGPDCIEVVEGKDESNSAKELTRSSLVSNVTSLRDKMKSRIVAAAHPGRTHLARSKPERRRRADQDLRDKRLRGHPQVPQRLQGNQRVHHVRNRQEAGSRRAAQDHGSRTYGLPRSSPTCSPSSPCLASKTPPVCPISSRSWSTTLSTTTFPVKFS